LPKKVNAVGEYEKELAEARHKVEMLQCQHDKSKGYKSPNCEECRDRFICGTVVAKRFIITELFSGYTNWGIFAESAEEAEELYQNYIGEDFLVEGKTDTYGEGIEIEEDK
jgi:hypothetical protein